MYSAGFQVSDFDVDAQVFGDEFVLTNLFKNWVSFTYVSWSSKSVLGLLEHWCGGLTKYVALPYDVPSSLQRPEKVKSKGTKKICSLTKGQTKSKWFFQADVSSKKRTNEFDFTTIYNDTLGQLVFVRILEEIEDTKKTFRN